MRNIPGGGEYPDFPLDFSWHHPSWGYKLCFITARYMWKSRFSTWSLLTSQKGSYHLVGDEIPGSLFWPLWNHAGKGGSLDYPLGLILSDGGGAAIVFCGIGLSREVLSKVFCLPRLSPFSFFGYWTSMFVGDILPIGISGLSASLVPSLEYIKQKENSENSTPYNSLCLKTPNQSNFFYLMVFIYVISKIIF